MPSKVKDGPIGKANAMAKTTFRKSDVKRAILAAESAGMKVGRVEVDPTGKIILIPGVRQVAGGETVNEWDASQDDAA